MNHRITSLLVTGMLGFSTVSLSAEPDLLRGKTLNRSTTHEQKLPASSERALVEFDAISASDLRSMRKAATPSTESGGETFVLGGDNSTVNFESGQADLLPAAGSALQAVIDKYAGGNNLRLQVVGHTDSQRLSARARKRFTDNQGLSEARAATVATWLRERLQLSAEQIGIAGRGELEPIGDNGTAEGMARNRRVEIIIWADPVAATAATKEAEKWESGCGPDGAATVNDSPFRVTVDGVPLEEDQLRPEADRERCVDVALEQAELQIKYDPLNVAPALNVWAIGDGLKPGETIEFGTWSNYTNWIRSAEIRIFVDGGPIQGAPLAVLPVEPGSFVDWQVPSGQSSRVNYVLRVIDAEGRFDETAPKVIEVLEHRRGVADADAPARERLVGYGENSRLRANIPVHGGTVSVSGRLPDTKSTVRTLGAEVPVDADGDFATRQIVPAGPRTVEVSVSDAEGSTRVFRRNLSIADEDWFYVAMGDLTVGDGSVSGASRQAVQALTGDEQHYDKNVYLDGRGAFYLRGKIKGKYLLKMSADTGEQPFEDLFSNFTRKDPRYLLRRIDPDRFYPVYGDDSVMVDDAPTQGKFFVRLERGDSHVMWGNFQTEWTGTELTQFSRGLYGGNLSFKSERTTPHGEKTTTVNAFAAEPGTLAAREEFRSTGGSLYYLRQRDVTEGSERVWIEVRDRDSEFVVDRRPLVPSQDYEVNYLQGRLLLNRPVAMVEDHSGLVQTSTLNGNPVYVVVTYEYVPGLERLDDLSYGGRGSQWIGEHLRIGASTFRQGDRGFRQKLHGLDASLLYKPGTHLDVEVARSDGAGSLLGASIDGGFQFNSSSGREGKADAQRISGKLDLAEVSEGLTGTAAAYWQDTDAGFSGPGQLNFNGESVEQRGLQTEVALDPITRLMLKADERLSDSQDYLAGEASLQRQISSEWALAVGVRSDDRSVRLANASEVLSEDGSRTDLVLRADFTPLQDVEAPAADALAASVYKPWDLYGFVQGTVERSGDRRDNNRGGLGGSVQATDRLRVGAEVSEGDGGFGAKASGDWRVNDRSNLYLNYALETERPELTSVRGRQGDLTAGSNYRLSDTVQFFGESRWRNGGGQESLTNAFGVELAPTDRLSAGFDVEVGKVTDRLAGDLKRRAAGLSMAYLYEDIKYTSALEYRQDEGNNTERKTWLMRNTLGSQISPAWRLLGKLNFSYSEASEGAFFDGDYLEGVLGAAYRPVDNDRWNTLFKYTYFYELPSPGQLGGNGQSLDFAQRSHVLSVDTIYDVDSWLSLGFKYGLRIGELQDGRVGGPWFDSRADLIVARADLQLVREWDAVVEWRHLSVNEAEDDRSGALVAVYRHFGGNLKAGVGYNFTDFSDDLTDLSYDHRGWFVNILTLF